ncbi:hypothetical protein TNCV_2470811 [Trichonephila clavipes]|nr:hypothetical protein TNCV_2470811 [Trichonephila clavipes]
MPLIYAFHQKLDKVTPRQQRHLEYIVQFTFHVPEDNIIGDALPRIDELHLQSAIHYEGLAQAQDILSSLNSSLKLEKVPICGSNFDIFRDISAEKKIYIFQKHSEELCSTISIT